MCPVPASRRSRYLNLVAGRAEPPLPYVVDSTFRLKAGLRPYRLVGYTPTGVCPALVRSPGGRYLIYGISRDGWPALEGLDLLTGRRFLFHIRACDPAWGRNGQIAYVHYVSFDSNSGVYTDRIMVQQGLRGTPSAWTGDAAWVNLIWAGEHLLADDDIALPAGFDQGPLVILDGPGQQRSLDGHPGERGPFSTVVALNPDGTEALLNTQRPGPYGGGAGSQDLATLIRIRDDTVLSTVEISRNETGEVIALAPDGTWMANKIIATGGVFAGGTAHPPAVLVMLTVTGNRVQLRAVKPFLENGSPPMGQNLAFASQPTPLDASGSRVAVWFGELGHLQYLACNTVTGRCNASRNYGDPWQGTTTAFASNASRP